jgi:hypothetical protein
MPSLGAVVISRNDNYTGDLPIKFTYCINSLINYFDKVYYIDWNSPDDKSLLDEVKSGISKTKKLHFIQITQEMARELTNHDPEVQKCVEVLARNIGIRRLDTDYIVSTNSDIMCLDRDNIIDGILGERTFHTVARRHIDLSQVIAYPPGSNELHDYLVTSGIGGQLGAGSPIPGDRWSLIACPGDFQLAHRDVWYGIKGFDENLLYRGYGDSNVQRKADYYGYSQALVYNISAYHFTHYPNTGSTGGGIGRMNDEGEALMNFQGTKNLDTWGFSDREFDEVII